MSTESSGISQAKEDFRQARRQAHIKQAMSHLTGEQTGLLSYEEVQKDLKPQGQTEWAAIAPNRCWKLFWAA